MKGERGIGAEVNGLCSKDAFQDVAFLLAKLR
jgi:hypothetical protein